MEGRGTTQLSHSEGITMGWQQIHRKLHKRQNNTAAEIRLEVLKNIETQKTKPN